MSKKALLIAGGTVLTAGIGTLAWYGICRSRLRSGSYDHRGNKIHTLEQHLADPTSHPYVSVFGDVAHTPDDANIKNFWHPMTPRAGAFPYGQRLQIDAWPNAIFRVVDYFVVHHMGDQVALVPAVDSRTSQLAANDSREPFCVATTSEKTKVPKNATVTLVANDHLDTPGRQVDFKRIGRHDTDDDEAKALLDKATGDLLTEKELAQSRRTFPAVLSGVAIPVKKMAAASKIPTNSIVM